MTTRERKEAKIAKRLEWAEKRESKANAALNSNPDLRHDWAFITQPGHIPERARMNRADDRAFESLAVAADHRTKAAGIAHQLDRSVYSDDPDAIEALEERIRENEAKRDRMKDVNRLWKAKDRSGLAALGIDMDKLTARLAADGPYWGGKPHLPYELTNLGARIRTDRERVGDIKARKNRTDQADTLGGVLIERVGQYARITFADKPARDILDALRAAGFEWGGGYWFGKSADIPPTVKES